MYDLAYVSVTVTSQVTHLPLCHGIKEAPSGLLPLLSRHRGSLIDCIFALVIVRHTMSFKMLRRVCLPEFFKHEKQCSPRASIVCPHWQSRGRHIVAPRRRATAIRMASLSRKRPQLDNGYFVLNTVFVSSHMYQENPEGTQVIVGSINMGYISDTARNRTHNLFRPNREPIPLGHNDGLLL